MKINSKAELKALIKECLVEILSDGGSSTTTTHRPRQQVRTESHSNNLPLPPTIPSSMRSLFSDSQRRASEHMYQETSQIQKQSEVLGEMADTWSGMAFAGEPLPARAMNPLEHRGTVHSHRQLSDDDSYNDDGFDPYEVVKNSIPNRR